MKVVNLAKFAIAPVLLLGSYVLPASSTGGYHLLKKISLPAAPGGGEYFDYVNFDAVGRRVYFSHGTEVIVFNPDSGSIVGKIMGLKRCHGITTVNELGKGYIADGDRSMGRVVVFDLKTLKNTGEIEASADANAIIYDSASKHVFSFNKAGKNATVIDPVKDTVVGTIALQGVPDFPAADGKGTLWVNSEDTNEVLVIDSRAMKVKARWPTAPAGEPTSMAMDQEHRRLLIGARNPKMFIVMDADSGKIIGAPVPIGDRVDATTYDPATRLAAVSTRDGLLSVFHEDSPDQFSAVETVKTEFGAKTMALDPKTHTLYLDTSDFNPAATPTAQQPNPQPTAKPGTFRLLVYAR